MENIIKEGEQMMDGGNNNNQGQSNDNQSYGQSSNNNQSSNEGNNQSSNEGNNQQQSSGNSSGGGFMSGMKQNTEDAYINNGRCHKISQNHWILIPLAEANSFLTKEGLPSGMDGAVDGVLDTEVNKYA
jgi:hypothetical protein